MSWSVKSLYSCLVYLQIVSGELINRYRLLIYEQRICYLIIGLIIRCLYEIEEVVRESSSAVYLGTLHIGTYLQD